MAYLLGGLGGDALRADGIALSTDGRVWTKGVGGLGEGWGQAGNSITVQQGGTLYVKYYRENRDQQTLYFAEHGREWGRWTSAGPKLEGDVGCNPSNAVVLKISDVGTPKSTMAWTNGSGKSGLWGGLTNPGAYDLAVHGSSRWTLPPIVVTEEYKPSVWGRFLGWLRSDVPDATPQAQTISVPDEGGSIWLLGSALVWLAMAKGWGSSGRR